MAGKILTKDDLAHLAQEMRCRQALKMIDVPEEVISKLDGPVLFQVAHLCVMIDQPMHYRDAIRWVNDHKHEVLNHAINVERDRLVGSDEGNKTDAGKSSDS